MKTKIYACYGILGHEKEVVYHVTPSKVCDEITVEIPEEFEPFASRTGCITVLLPLPIVNTPLEFALEEVLTSTKDGEPAIKLFDRCWKLDRVEGE